jgi:hypothetical protein
VSTHLQKLLSLHHGRHGPNLNAHMVNKGIFLAHEGHVVERALDSFSMHMAGEAQ